MSEGGLVLAVPSKGRLQANAAAFFARAGLAVSQAGGARDYRGALDGVPGAEVVFLSAAEIAAQLASGGVHLGITGEDLLRESVPDLETRLDLLTSLGFGRATVVVAVPRSWIDVRTIADLDEVAGEMRARHGRRLRVATKYLNLARRFFAERHFADYRLVESPGATEAAPAAGSADVIVDITTTGATLAANGLKPLEDGVILRSEANLVASLTAPWGETARRVAGTVLSRIAAEEAARTTREVRAAMPKDAAEIMDLADRHGARGPAGRSLDGLVVLHCPADRVFGLVEDMVAAGAQDVTVRALEYVFRTSNPLTERLFARLSEGDAGSGSPGSPP